MKLKYVSLSLPVTLCTSQFMNFFLFNFYLFMIVFIDVMLCLPFITKRTPENFFVYCLLCMFLLIDCLHCVSVSFYSNLI